MGDELLGCIRIYDTKAGFAKAKICQKKATS